jgi:putative inorganic carbon (hco3(-)) transporter
MANLFSGLRSEKRKDSPVFIFLALLAFSLLIAFLIGSQGYQIGMIAVMVLAAIPLLYKSVTDTEFGLLFLTWYSYFLFLIGRVLYPAQVPVGIGVEALEIVLLLGVIYAEIKQKKTSWADFNNPVTYIFIFYQVYNVLQFFNPYATSLAGWFVSTRGIIFDSLLYYLLVKLLTNLDLIKRYTKAWLLFSLLAALYGIYQEIFGYQDFEWQYIMGTPGLLALIKNWEVLRKFSFLSDVAAFGIAMSYSAIFCAVLAMAPFEFKRRFFLLVCSLIMLVSMSFSGTRTATAMIPVGACIYILMHINNWRTILILIVLVMAFVVVLFGPFHGVAISRVRTTFEPSTDASMNVREVNRARAQPLIQSHPIGWGVNTTDTEGELLSPGHTFAGFPTDSGFLKTAITIGWIGLLIQMALYFAVLATGATNFYSAKDPLIKALYAAYLAAFFSLVVANYAQSAMGQKPTGLFVFSIFVLMPNLIKLDRKKADKVGLT